MIDVTEHLGLVNKLINKNHRWMLEYYSYDDIFQAGCVGLVNAARLYKEGSVKFSTYATRSITNEINGMYRDDKYIPNPYREKVNKYLFYLDDKIKKGSKICYKDILMEEKDSFVEVERSVYIDQLLNSIEKTERIVITEYFFNEKSQQQIAGIIGMSQIYVSRLITKSLEKMRRVV